MKNAEKKIFNFGLCLCLALANVIAVRAGGAIETIDITNAPPSPIPGHVIAKVIGVKWDVRSIPVKYSMNTTLDPIFHIPYSELRDERLWTMEYGI
jgi:hypothetical protein